MTCLLEGRGSPNLTNWFCMLEIVSCSAGLSETGMYFGMLTYEEGANGRMYREKTINAS